MLSSLRELIPSFVNTPRRCHSTVRGLMNSCAPISGFVQPSVASRAICASCGGELVTGVGRALAHGLAGGQALAAGAFGEPVHADLDVHLVRDPKMLARFGAAAFASQPLAVDQVGARMRGTNPRAAQTRDRLAVKVLGDITLVEQRA